MYLSLLYKIITFLVGIIWSASILMLLGFFCMCCLTQTTSLRKLRNEHTNKAVGEKAKLANGVLALFFALISVKFFKISYFESLTDLEFFIQISVVFVILYMIMYLIAFGLVVNDDQIDKHLKESKNHDSMEMRCIHLYLQEYQYNYLNEHTKKKGISNTEAIKDILREQIKKEYTK